MLQIIDEKIDRIVELCRRYDVQCLEVFGSASNDTYDPSESDIDFIVEFPTLSPSAHADSFFNLLADLQDLFESAIDLMELSAIDNPYLLRSINEDRSVVYAA